MSNIQLYSNNAKTTLNAQLLVGGTTMTVAGGGGALFRTVASPNYELITLQRESDGAIEIVKVTTHTAASDTFGVIERAQEGTSALQFEIGDKVEARWTRGTAERITQNVPFTGASGVNSIDLQAYRSDPSTVGVFGDNSVAIGRENTIAAGSNGVAIGSEIGVGAGSAFHVAIGENITIDPAYDDGIAIGQNVTISANNVIAIGGASLTGGAYRSISLAWDCSNFGTQAVRIGTGFNVGDYSVGIGLYGEADGSYGVAIGNNAMASGQAAVALGANSYAASYRLAVGYGSNASGAAAQALGTNADASGTSALAIGYGAVVAGGNSLGIGYGVAVPGNYSIAIGYAVSLSSTDYAVAIGAYANVAYKGVALGARADASGNDYAVAIGYAAYAGDTGAVAIGYQANAADPYAVVLGYNASAYNGGDGGIAIGYNALIDGGQYSVILGARAQTTSEFAIGLGFEARPGVNYVAHIAAPIINIADHGGVGSGNARERLTQFAGVEVVLMSKTYDLTDATPFDGGTVGTKDFWVMPAGAKFYPDEAGVITDAENTVTVGPTVSFGHGGAGTEILNNQAIVAGNLGQSGGRAEYASAAPQGVGTISIAMNGAATATALTGRFYVRGMMVENTS